jgi:phosphoserine phosphatase
VCSSDLLQEIVEGIADELGFDGALGTVCEVRDGAYTGHAVRALHAENKAACVRELAEERGFDLDACTAYSDSHTDLPFLEAVGHPVVVNPDRELRGIAGERGWTILEFGARAYTHQCPESHRPSGAGRALRRRAGGEQTAPWTVTTG